MDTIERRFLPLAMIETRMEEGGAEENTLAGYGAVFHRDGDKGTEFEIFDGYIERFAPGAFDESLKLDDVRCLKNHNRDLVLGRSGAGTLTLSVDTKGLFYRCTLPATSYAADLKESVRRKDVTGSSIGFVTQAATILELENGVVIRQIDKAKLYDVGPVTYPAYEGTAVALRSADAAKRQMQDMLARRRSSVLRGIQVRGLRLNLPK